MFFLSIFVHFCPYIFCPIFKKWVPLGQKWTKMDKNSKPALLLHNDVSEVMNRKSHVLSFICTLFFNEIIIKSLDKGSSEKECR